MCCCLIIRCYDNLYIFAIFLLSPLNYHLIKMYAPFSYAPSSSPGHRPFGCTRFGIVIGALSIFICKFCRRRWRVFHIHAHILRHHYYLSFVPFHVGVSLPSIESPTCDHYDRCDFTPPVSGAIIIFRVFSFRFWIPFCSESKKLILYVVQKDRSFDPFQLILSEIRSQRPIWRLRPIFTVTSSINYFTYILNKKVT